MRFNKLDLNLLVALDALLAEQAIARAATRLNLTPSATSNALARLREYFDDELLVQVGRKMELTPLAEGLREPVRDVLVRIESTIAIQPDFDPTSTDRCFRIFASDYTQTVFAPHLLTLAAEQRCTARFEFLPQVSNPQRSLERGEADLLVIPNNFLSPDHPSEVLYNEDFTCVVWQGSTLSRGELNETRYAQAGHVVMRPPNDQGDSFESWFLKRHGFSRKVAVTSYSFATLPGLVVGTDFIATVHSRLARHMSRIWPLVLRPSPLPIPVMAQSVQWHRHRRHDLGLRWLRNAMHDAVRRMDAALPATGD